MQTTDIVIVGAGPTARALGQVLSRTNAVCLVDSNREHCTFAEAGGLPVVCGNALDPDVLHQAGADRAHTFITLTANAEVNALAAQLARTTFDVPEIHLLRRNGTSHDVLLDHLRASTLFGGAVAITDWDYWIQHEKAERMGLTLRRTFTPASLFRELQTHRRSLPLAVRRGDRYLPFHSGTTLCDGDRVILLRNDTTAPLYFDRFDRLAARCPILDLDRRMSLDAFFNLAAATLAGQIGLSPADLTELFRDREATSSTVIAPGLAIPHVLIDGTGHFHLLVARCREGILFPGQREEVTSVFMLVRSPDERNFHLRALAAIAQIAQDPDFETNWMLADGPEGLRKLILEAERRRYPEEIRSSPA